MVEEAHYAERCGSMFWKVKRFRYSMYRNDKRRELTARLQILLPLRTGSRLQLELVVCCCFTLLSSSRLDD